MNAAAELVERARAAGAPIAAIEAYWHNDLDGLWLELVAIVERSTTQYEQLALARAAATAPPWPEARELAALGEAIGGTLGVPFYFPARDRPSDEAARWSHRERARPCIDCGMLLDQHPGVHWLGMCYACHLTREDQTARVRIEVLRDLDAREFERVRNSVDAALHASQAGRFYAGSRIAGRQEMAFLCSHARRAAEIVIRALRAAGSLADVRVRAARSLTDTGELVWPPSQATSP